MTEPEALTIIPNVVHEVDGDLLAVTRFKNNLLFKLIPHRQGARIARQIGVSYAEISELLCLRKSPFNTRKESGTGTYRLSAQKIADYFKIDVETLFPPDLYRLKLPKLVERAFHSDQIMPMLEARRQNLLPAAENAATAEIEKQETRSVLQKAMKEILNAQQRSVITMLFGLDGSGEHTHKEIGERLGVSGARVEQIKNLALMKLRHPAHKELLNSVALPEPFDGLMNQDTPFGEITVGEGYRLTLKDNPANLPQAIRYITIQRQKEKEQDYERARYEKLVKEHPHLALDLERPEKSKAFVSFERMMKMAVIEAGFSFRLWRLLDQSGVTTIGDLFAREEWREGAEIKFTFRWTAQNLLKIHHFGKKCLAELDGFYVKHGLSMPPTGVYSASQNPAAEREPILPDTV